ncbi:endonuclease/exonuclease/phosphatase family protein [Gordonia shandongensis]|uniref:endonuclease/exonuclease/phosphatase family protein n=1 Tax=Gordonia shandongensis TaxID=376351 RepID=UPI000405466E|nr:endonuclease/exonuclease/phosphatase family protein [Gordonia shandongensis]
MTGLLRRVVVGAGAVALVAGCLAVAVRYWPGASRVTAAAASVSPLVLGAAVVLAAVAFAVARSRPGMVAAAVMLAVGVGIQLPAFVGDDPPTGETITVMSANIELGRGDVDELAALVGESAVDVLAVQEITPAAADRVARSTIVGDLPYSLVRTGPAAGGSALYSRYPLVDPVELGGFTLASLAATARIPGYGDVRLFTVHPVPPLFPDRWADELSTVGTALQAVPGGVPVIALGDFNATGDNAHFRRLLTGGYRDAGEVVGAGWVPTYPTDAWFPPLVGIDHVLIRGLSASSVTAHDLSGSDHRSLLVAVGSR